MLERLNENPILSPNPTRFWESEATFNPSVIRYEKNFLMLYRSMIKVQKVPGDVVSVSSVGIARGNDAVHFGNREFFFGPEHVYEAYGCEDPRVTKFGKEYYIFYTAVSGMPPRPRDVRLALATTKDFKEVEKLGIVCPFNSKSGSLFPRKINGKIAMLLTMYPDAPPSRLTVVYFDKIEDLLKKEFWDNYLRYQFEGRNIKFSPHMNPFMEAGTQPIETEEGWLIFMPDIVYEHGEFLEFRISAALLDIDNPTKVIAVTKKPLLSPEMAYETRRTFNPKYIAMPTGALVDGDKVYVYYGASDMYCAVASYDIKKLLKFLVGKCKV